MKAKLESINSVDYLSFTPEKIITNITRTKKYQRL